MFIPFWAFAKRDPSQSDEHRLILAVSGGGDSIEAQA